MPTTSLTKTSPAKTSPAKTSPAKTSPAKTSPAKTSPAKTSPAKTSPAKTSLTKAALRERSTATRAPGPRRWKMWVLLTCAIYPLILLIVTLTDPLTHGLPAAARFLVVVPLMTASVVWGVLPQIRRWFGRWLTR